VLVEARDRLRRLAVARIGEDPVAGERVVGRDQAALGELRQHRFVVVDVAGLVGVDEDEVPRAVERGDRLERGPHVDGDPLREGGLRDVAARERRVLLVELARVQLAALRQRLRHHDRRVAAVGADLEHAAGAERVDEHLQQPPCDGAGQHPGRAQALVRLGGERVEQPARRRRHRLGVFVPVHRGIIADRAGAVAAVPSGPVPTPCPKRTTVTPPTSPRPRSPSGMLHFRHGVRHRDGSVTSCAQKCDGTG
jgi:hypothetical protein